MSAGHSHDSRHSLDGGHGLVAPAPVRAVLAVLVVAISAAALAGLAMLRADRDTTTAPRTVNPYAGVTFVSGEIRSITNEVCEGAPVDRAADGTIPDQVACVTGTVRVTGDPAGDAEIEVPLPPQVARAGLGPGDQVRLARYPGEAGSAPTYAWVDHDRRLPLALLGVAFAVVVVAIARLKGLAAIVGLGIAYPTIALFMLPALRAGENPVAVALTGATVIMVVVLYLAHGVTTKTTVALLGTLAGLGLSALLAWWVTAAAHLDGLSSEQNYELSRLTTGAGLGGIVLCGVIIAGLGVLNDVTIAQAASVWELRAQAPHLPARALFASGMRIGRDHLASTVYTIAFAYAGAALPTLLLIDLYSQPLGEVLNGGEVAEEIVRTLVGSIGLALTIPLTTAIAAAVAVTLTAAPGPAAPGPAAAGTRSGRRRAT